eukprot:353002_1
MMANYISTILLLLIYFLTVYSYNNGIGEKPLRGWSSWYSYSSNISEYLIKNNTLELINSGLSKAGYNYINVDEGWIFNRSQNGTLISDATKFPNGMYNLGEFIHSHGLKYGLYSSRGKVQCSTTSYHAPGSYGYYEQDAQYMAYNNADYFKFDSCGGVGDMQDAFNQYKQFGEYLNQTGRPIYYDLCGWYWYYAINGSDYSNSWRISGDDANWQAIMNTMYFGYSGMWKYGIEYGWNNWDMLYSENINTSINIAHITPMQSRLQFSIWSVASSNLILGNMVSSLTDFDMETYTNMDVININQDLGRNDIQSGFKIMGTTAIHNISVFGKMLSDGSFVAVFVNTIDDKNATQNITCNEGCFLQMGFDENVEKLLVKDIWSNTTLGVIERRNVYTKNEFNGVLELAMCTGDKYQIFEIGSNMGYIKSKLNNGYLQIYNCNNNEKYTTIVSGMNVDNECNGINAKWNFIEIENASMKYKNCNGTKCYSICNENYEENKNNNDNCLYIDTIKGNEYPFVFASDG